MVLGSAAEPAFVGFFVFQVKSDEVNVWSLSLLKIWRENLFDCGLRWLTQKC